LTPILFAEPTSNAPTSNAIPSVFGLAKLGKMAFDGVDLGPTWQRLATRFSQNNADVAALMDMCILDQLLNNADRGLILQEHALGACRLYQLPAKTSPARLRVLGLATAGNISANTPIEFLIEDSDITLYLLYLVPGMPVPPLPEHDLAFVLAAESENSLVVLQAMERLVAEWTCPVINLPGLIPQVGREHLYKVLAPISGIEIPATVLVQRTLWERFGNGEIPVESLLPGGRFPLIVRPRDSHAGLGLAKIEDRAAALSYLSERQETEFYVSRFVDYRSPDGLYRKYRVAVIEGKAFPTHMGISDHWMIHYLNAGMLESAEKRAEEERFMDRFDTEFGLRHGRAISEMAQVTGLDYFGIDCSETQDGKLLVFEAGTALVVHNMDQADIFPYKGSHMLTVFEAFRAMMYRKSGV